MSCHPDAEQVDLYREVVRTARVAHRCGACRETIAPGHRYARVVIVFERSAETILRCARCQAMHVALRSGPAWPDDELGCGHPYEEVFGAPPPDALAALAFALPGEVDL